MKIAGLRGKETVRGEKGWTKWDNVTLVPYHDARPPGYDPPFAVNMQTQQDRKDRIQDWDRIYLFLHEHGWAISGRSIENVEIVILHSGAVIVHVVLEQVQVDHFDRMIDDKVWYYGRIWALEKNVEWLIPVRGLLPRVANHLRGLWQGLGGVPRHLGELLAKGAAQKRKASNKKK